MKCPKCQTDNPDTQRFCGECATSLQPSKEIDVTATIETPKEELTTGSTFAGRYQIIEELGKGGMGRVYRALDKELNEEVAIKLIKPEIAKDKKTIERFKNELRFARKISHRNVGRMYELMEDRGSHFITMEYVPGQDLRGLIRQTGQLTTGKAIAIAKEICDGLGEAHHHGVIHRDLKPSNIIIDRNGNARILDFGIARSLEAKGITGAGVMIGTPEYMSPEQVEAKEVDQRSDIYSLGIIMYEMLTGRIPFEADTPFAVDVKHKSETPVNPKEYNPQISDDLDKAILKCLEKDKKDRYQNVGEIKSELEKIEQGLPTTDRVVLKKKTITSKEITVQFSMKKIFIPALVVIVFAVIGLLIWSPWNEGDGTLKLLEKPSIAVLPFEDRSSKKDQGYLCEGLSESIINALTKIEGLRVPARSSSFSFKDKDNYIEEIGEKLNIQTVLEGSLQKVENRIRITAQLINVADESVLWSDQYNREEDHIFDIQDEIALAIVGELRVKLVGEDQENIIKRYTENIEAYNLYLQGRFFWNKRTEEGLTKAIEFFKQAIEKDPNYAIAYAGLADSYLVSSAWDFIPPLEAYPKAKEAALKSLDIDNLLAEAHTALASVYMDYEWEWEKAEKEFKRAIELNPSYATAHHWYLEYLSLMGDYDEAIIEGKRAQELDPLSLMINASLGAVLAEMGELDDAIVQLQKTIEMHPNSNQVHWYLGDAYLRKCMYKEALAAFNRAGNKAYKGITYAKMGNLEEARNLLRNLLRESKESNISYKQIAGLYFTLGDYDQGFAYLEKALEKREFLMKFIKNDFLYDDKIRSDPRFKDILKRMNLGLNPLNRKGEK